MQRCRLIHYNGVDYSLANGLTAKDGSYKSLRAEGGVNTGITLAIHNTEVRPYLHLAVADETENNNKMDINGVGINDSTDGSEGVVGLGTEVKFTKSLHAWAGADYAKGHDIESPWQVNAGVSWSW
ncbi:autotransporter outer membrane beta-barrel domain-containing protein [Klebsiella aerogenes]|nr:autotransporter outer membrane beta-barrel domain-containing protein [Klebsiella aerogenes]